MNQKTTQKGHGYFRKSKAYGLVCGIALGAMLFMSNSVSADEVTPVETAPTAVLTDNPATNLQSAQPETPVANQEATAQAGSQTGTLTAEVNSNALDQAVSSAEKAGVEVKKDAAVTHGTLAEAQADLNSQVETVKSAEEAQVKADQARDEVIEANKNIEADNNAEKARVEELNKTGQSAVDQKNAQNAKEVAERNKNKQEAYNNSLAELEAKTGEEGYLTEVVSKRLLLDSEPEATITKITGGESTTNTAAAEYVRNNAIYGNDILSGYLLGDGEATSADFVFAKTGETITVEYTGLKTAKFDDTLIDKLVYKYTVLRNDKSGSTLLQFHQDPTKTLHYWELGARVEIGFEALAYDKSGNQIDLTGSAVSFSSLNAQYDEYNSYEFVKDFKGKLVPINGSSLTVNNGEVKSIKSNVSKDKGSRLDQSEWDLVGHPNAYYGAMAGVADTKSIQFTFGAQGRNEVWFAFNTDIKADVLPALVLETPTVETYTPIKPTLKPLLPVPEKETVKVKVHDVLLDQKPANDKDVINADQVSIDGQLVPKGSTVTWTLSNDPLKAGRETITAYTMSDPLPSGFEIDSKATAEASPAYLVTFDETGKASLVATEATLKAINADLTKDVAIPVATIVGRVINDGATYKNTFTTTITTPKGEYVTVSDTPVVYTPGNNPETPRPPKTPGGETPTPYDNLIEPKKDVVDDKGNSIDGKSVLPNTTLNYLAKQDFDQYRGMLASHSAILKSFLHLDDLKDEALDGKSLVVNSITASNGDDVRELLEMRHVLSLDTLEEKLQTLIKDSGISPVGEFYLWVAKDPQKFFEAYVQKGLDITYNLSFKIKETFKEGDITNQTFQIDFGNGYAGNIVVNNLPLLAIHKDVLDKDGKSIDGGTVQIGDEVTYKLEGWVIPADRGYDLYEYRFVDKLQATHDEYQGYRFEAKVDITLADGTVIKAGTDLKDHVETVYDAKSGLFVAKFKEDFLKSVIRESAFGADGYLTVKRIKDGDVTNSYQLYVNGNPVVSNVVITHTPPKPTPPAPEAPTPEKPVTPTPVTPETPVATAKVLPQTGDSGSMAMIMSGIMSAIAGLGLAARKRKED